MSAFLNSTAQTFGWVGQPLAVQVVQGEARALVDAQKVMAAAAGAARQDYPVTEAVGVAAATAFAIAISSLMARALQAAEKALIAGSVRSATL